MQRLEEEEDDITEEEHVKHVLNSYAAEAHDGADGGVVPTEYLQEDLGVTLELPRSLQRMENPVCLVVAAFPAAVVGLSLLVSCVASLWLASSPADLFSVRAELWVHGPSCGAAEHMHHLAAATAVELRCARRVMPASLVAHPLTFCYS